MALTGCGKCLACRRGFAPILCERPSDPDDPAKWVDCPECGTQQEDMGVGVRCDACGYGPMPIDAPRRKPKKRRRRG